MLEDLATWYNKPGSPKVTPEWIAYIRQLDVQKEQLKRRFLGLMPRITEGTEFLTHILDLADIPYIAKQGNDFYAYMTYIPQVQAQVSSIFDLIRNGRPVFNRYIKRSGFPCYEFTSPVSDVDHLALFPMGQPYYAWRDTVAPLTLWWHDSTEYTLDLMQNQIKFYHDVPETVLFFLDVPSLCIKYLKYYQDPSIRADNKTPLQFIHDDVYFAFFDQIQSIWIFKQHLLALDILLGYEDASAITETVKYTITQYGSVGQRYPMAMNLLLKWYTDVAKGNYLPQSLFNTPFFPLKGLKSFNGLVSWMTDWLDIPHLTQYKWVRILRDMPYLEYVAKVYALNPKHVRWSVFKVQLDTLKRKYTAAVPWGNVKSAILREYLKQKFEMLSQLGT